MEYFFSGDEENLLASIVKLDFSISVAFSLTIQDKYINHICPQGPLPCCLGVGPGSIIIMLNCQK